MHVLTSTRLGVRGVATSFGSFPFGVEVELSAEALAAIEATPGMIVTEVAATAVSNTDNPDGGTE